MDLKMLKNRNLVLVILGQFVSGFGTLMQSFALSLYVLQRTGSAALFASVLVVAAIPRILLTPFAGVLADRFSRKKMIVLMDMLSGVVVAAMIGVFIITGELSILAVYILVLSLTVINVFFTPSMTAIVPDIVKKEKLADANSLMEMFFSILSLVSPIVAGLLFGAFGLFPIMIINAVSFFSSSISEMFIKIEKESIQTGDDKEPFVTSFKHGIKFIKDFPEFIMMIGVAIIANFALNPIFSVALPIVFLKDFGLSEQIYGVLSSLMMIGLLVAPIFAVKIIKKHHYSKLVYVILSFDAILCGAISVMAINGLFPSIWINTIIIMVLFNILIMTVMIVNLGITTARQILVPGNMMGRVSSVVSTFAMMATPLGQALIGSLLDKGDSYIIIASYAGLLLLSGIMAKVGFTRLAKKGKMDTTIGLTINEEKVVENVG